MADSLTQSSWIVQILFGRYQSGSSISWTEIIVLAVIGVVLVYVYLFFLRLKFVSFTRAMQRLPRSSLPLSSAELSRKMYGLLINEMVRVDSILDVGLAPAPTAGGGDEGWGAEGSKIANVHFNTSIAKSFILLESTALSRRPGLRHSDWRSVREYVQQLRKAFPALRQQLCDDYIACYERAVFGSAQHKFSFDEYSEFMKTVYEMVNTINDKSWQQQQREQQ